MTWERIKDATASGRASIYGGVATSVDKVQEVTGLKLGEAFRVGEEKREKVHAQVTEVVKAAEQKIDDVKATGEQKAQDKKLV